MFLNLHLLRAAAALAVVYFHATSDAGLNFRIHVGAHGVDVFFVVSGFIIAYTGACTPDRFLLRRIVRIVPAYWTATLAVFALAAIVVHAYLEAPAMRALRRRLLPVVKQDTATASPAMSAVAV